METRSSNRLCPTAVVPTTSPLLNGRIHPSHAHKAGSQRRRCRSETLPTTAFLASAAHPTTDAPHRSIFQGFRPVLQKYTPVAVLRNQESAKNIFSCPAASNESRSGRMQTRQHQQPQLFRKENIETDRLGGGGGVTQYTFQPAVLRQARLQEFERFREQQTALAQAKYGSGGASSTSPEKTGADVWQRASQRTAAVGRIELLSGVDGQKRRVRSRSECEASDVLTGCRLSPIRNGGDNGYGPGDVSIFEFVRWRL